MKVLMNFAKKHPIWSGLIIMILFWIISGVFISDEEKNLTGSVIEEPEFKQLEVEEEKSIEEEQPNEPEQKNLSPLN